MKVSSFTAKLKRDRGRAGRFVTSWESVPVPGPLCSLITPSYYQTEQAVGIFKESVLLLVQIAGQGVEKPTYAKPDGLCTPLDLQGCSISSSNRPCLSVLSGGQHKVATCFKSFSAWHILLGSLCSHFQQKSSQRYFQCFLRQHFPSK